MPTKCERNGHDWAPPRGNWVTCKVCRLARHVDDGDDPDVYSDDEEWD